MSESPCSMYTAAWMLLLSQLRSAQCRLWTCLFLLGKAQSSPREVPAAGCDFPEEVISPKHCFLAQAVRQDFGNCHCVMLSTGVCHTVLIRGVRDAQAPREVQRHASMQTPPQTVIGFLSAWVFCPYDAISPCNNLDIVLAGLSQLRPNFPRQVGARGRWSLHPLLVRGYEKYTEMTGVKGHM